MIAKAILDTDILAEFFKGHNPDVASHASQYLREHGVLSFTSVTVYEIVYGLEVKGAVSQLSKVKAWFEQNEEFTPTDSDFLTVATIRATARRQGYVVELPDCLIASISVRLGRTLVTGNTEDFKSIQRTGFNLVFENWR